MALARSCNEDGSGDGYSHEGGDRRRTPRPGGGATPSSSTLRPPTAHPLQRWLGAGGGTGTQVGSPVLRRGDGRPAGARSRPARHYWVKGPPRDSFERPAVSTPANVAGWIPDSPCISWAYSGGQALRSPTPHRVSRGWRSG